MHLWSVFLVQNPQKNWEPAAPRPRLQRRLRRRPRPLTLRLAVVVIMALTAWNFMGEARYTAPPRSSDPLSPLSGHSNANTKVDPDAAYGSDTTQGVFGDY